MVGENKDCHSGCGIAWVKVGLNGDFPEHECQLQSELSQYEKAK